MKLISLAVLPTLALLAGCATTTPPQELVSARSAYNRASQGPANSVKPADVHEAQNALNKAEQSFLDNGDTPTTKDLAYVAQRKAELAEILAQGEQANQNAQLTSAEIEKRRDAELARTKGALNAQNQTIQLQGKELEQEKARREEAEKRASQAAADLARIASVKQETRGMVITLSGEVLFKSNENSLLPGAQAKLSQVADALTKTDPDSKIVVQGHTDSQGQAAYNNTLSEKRAGAVRDYLVSHGIAADRITSQGFGPSQPIADNNSAEGRANNRRVEIVVQPPSRRAGN